VPGLRAGQQRQGAILYGSKDRPAKDFAAECLRLALRKAASAGMREQSIDLTYI
jgi:hypothetical protein